MNKKFLIFLISGKAGSGKDIVATYINDYLKEKKYNAIITQYAKYIKMYAQELTNWDGNNNTKPREFLNILGTSIIRNKLNMKDFFIKRMIDDIKIYKFFVDSVIISDIRFPIEIDEMRKVNSNIISIHVKRNDEQELLNNIQKQHDTEIGLDNYQNFDYFIENNSDLDTLRLEVTSLVEEILNNEESNIR